MQAGTTDVVVGLGANLGARETTLASAAHALGALADARLVACSGLYESEALGPAQPDFLNAAVRLAWSASLEALLEHMQRIERAHGRERRHRWGPRTLDLDMLWASESRHTPTLTVPHPELERRWFALQPLLDVAPRLTAHYGRVLQALGGPRVPLETTVGPTPTWCRSTDPG